MEHNRIPSTDVVGRHGLFIPLKEFFRLQEASSDERETFFRTVTAEVSSQYGLEGLGLDQIDRIVSDTTPESAFLRLVQYGEFLNYYQLIAPTLKVTAPMIRFALQHKRDKIALAMLNVIDAIPYPGSCLIKAVEGRCVESTRYLLQEKNLVEMLENVDPDLYNTFCLHDKNLFWTLETIGAKVTVDLLVSIASLQAGPGYDDYRLLLEELSDDEFVQLRKQYAASTSDSPLYAAMLTHEVNAKSLM